MPGVRDSRVSPACIALGFWCAVFTPAHAETDVQLTASAPVVLQHLPVVRNFDNPVHSLALLNGGTLLATGATTSIGASPLVPTSAVHIWDVARGEERHRLKVDNRGVDALAVDPRGKFLVAGGASGVIKIWDTKTWKEIHTLGPTAGSVRGLAISPDGKILASASPDGQKGKQDPEFGIILWDITTGKKVRTLPLQPPEFGTTLLSFTPDSKRVLSGQDRSVRIWDVATGKEEKSVELRGVIRSLGSMGLRGDGQRLVTGVFEPKIRIWNTESWEEVNAWNAYEEGKPPYRGVACVGYSPDGKFVLSGGMDGRVCVWDASTGRRLLQLDARNKVFGGWITGVVMSSDGTLLAATHIRGTATIWRITAKAP